MGKMGKSGKRLIIPYVGIDRIVETLNVAYKKGVKDIKISKLASLMGCGVSNISNVSSTLKLLGLVELKKQEISLTNEGMEFIRAYNSGEIEKAKKIIRKGIEQSEALKFVKSLLDTRVQLTGEEIGRALADRFGKKWKTITSYRTFGNSCASIIGFAGFGFYSAGILSLKPVKMKAETKLYAPYAGFQPIINLLNALNSFKIAKISDLAKELKVKEGGISNILPVCILLNLVEKSSAGGYRITETGRKLVNPLLQKTEMAQIFRECLINSPYIDVILSLSQADKELKYEDLGEILAYLLKKNWQPQTKKDYGKKFVTWLKAAELIEKKAPNSFRLKNSEVKEALESQKKAENQIVDAQVIYEVGRILGVLEALKPNEENRKEFEDKISVLKTLLKEHKDLDLIFEMLKKNFQLSLETKNSSVYKSNIEFVRNKVKERLGMPTNQGD